MLEHTPALEADGVPRVYLLQTMRWYAATHLRAAGEFDVFALRHAQYYAALAEAAAQSAPGLDQRLARERLMREQANLLQAYAWSSQPAGSAELAERLSRALKSLHLGAILVSESR